MGAPWRLHAHLCSRAAEDCAAAPSCDPRGECVAACSDAAPCSDGVCHPVLAACVECVNAGDCVDANRPLCSDDARCAADDPEKPLCVDNRCEECRVDTDCPVDQPICEDGECKN